MPDSGVVAPAKLLHLFSANLDLEKQFLLIMGYNHVMQIHSRGRRRFPNPGNTLSDASDPWS
jgi:hypothetical protein